MCIMYSEGVIVLDVHICAVFTVLRDFELQGLQQEQRELKNTKYKSEFRQYNWESSTYQEEEEAGKTLSIWHPSPCSDVLHWS